jgi:hypothetical protein
LSLPRPCPRARPRKPPRFVVVGSRRAASASACRRGTNRPLGSAPPDSVSPAARLQLQLLDAYLDASTAASSLPPPGCSQEWHCRFLARVHSKPRQPPRFVVVRAVPFPAPPSVSTGSPKHLPRQVRPLADNQACGRPRDGEFAKLVFLLAVLGGKPGRTQERAGFSAATQGFVRWGALGRRHTAWY